MRQFLPILSIVAFSAPAFAQTIDSQGAAQLTKSLSRYVSKAAFDRGILKINADGDAYRIDFDFRPLVAMVPSTVPFKVDIAPYALKVRPLSGTTWQVYGPLMPNGSFELSEPSMRQRVEWSLTDGKMTGVYDTELAAFSSARASYAAIKVHTESVAGNGDTEYGAGSITMAATQSANGGVDFKSNQVASSYLQTQNIKVPGNEANFPISVKAGKSTMDAQASGLKAKAFLDMLAFGIAHPDLDKLKAGQSELRSLLTAALPFWDRQGGSYAMTDLSLNSPVGILRAAEIDTSFAMDGIEKSATLDYGTQVRGMEISSLFMPPWAKSLIPIDVDINAKGTNLDLEGPARKLIETFDLTKEPPVPASVTEEIAAAFKANPPKIVLSKSTFSNAETMIVAEGEMSFPSGNPVVRATFDATGYDKIVSAVGEAAKSNPSIEQLFGYARFVRNQANTYPGGHLKWTFEINADGSKRLNNALWGLR